MAKFLTDRNYLKRVFSKELNWTEHKQWGIEKIENKNIKTPQLYLRINDKFFNGEDKIKFQKLLPEIKKELLIVKI